MAKMTLLEKIRALNKLLQNAAGKPLNFGEMAEVLQSTIQADVFVVSRKGKVLGSALSSDFAEMWLRREDPNELRFPQACNDAFLRIGDTAVGVPVSETFAEIAPAFEGKTVTIVPVIGGTERIGTIVLSRQQPFNEDDLILAECGSTQVGMEILRIRAEEREMEARSKAIVSVAVQSLSFSEFEAVEQIFEELDGKEGLLVASKIADRAGITRSVIVNALRKLESAGVIETRSLGMKGTYIRILNRQLLQEIKRKRN
jgi:transcriptional pleiotropic repressor